MYEALDQLIWDDAGLTKAIYQLPTRFWYVYVCVYLDLNFMLKVRKINNYYIVKFRIEMKTP